MASKPILSYSPARPGALSRVSQASYYLSTRTELVRFYLFQEPAEDGTTPWTLIDGSTDVSFWVPVTRRPRRYGPSGCA